MTPQDVINATFDVGKNMSEQKQEAYLEQLKRRTCHQKEPTPPAIDADQPDTEMEEMVRNVELHKDTVNEVGVGSVH